MHDAGHATFWCIASTAMSLFRCLAIEPCLVRLEAAGIAAAFRLVENSLAVETAAVEAVVVEIAVAEPPVAAERIVAEVERIVAGVERIPGEAITVAERLEPELIGC